jgi:hypothetical protein
LIGVVETILAAAKLDESFLVIGKISYIIDDEVDDAKSLDLILMWGFFCAIH